MRIETPVQPPVSSQGSRRRGTTYVLVLNWNGWRDTVESVRSAMRLKDRPSEILVIDNGSSDDSEERIRERCPETPFLQTGENLGYAGGNNMGIRHALSRGADYIWLLNN